nr:Na+/H+ antiporter NhaC family protein [Anaerobacillus sp. CMMVII]
MYHRYGNHEKSAIPTMILGIVVGLATSIILRGDIMIADWMNLIQNGYISGAENEEIAKILDRGGIQSMMWAVSLLLLTLSMGGLLSVLGVIERLIESIQGTVKQQEDLFFLPFVQELVLM